VRARRRYLAALATVVRNSAVPYGYTVSLWTAGAVLEHGHGTPGVGQAYLFLAGAAAGFVLVALVAWRAAPHSLEPTSRDLVRTGAINVLALALALGAASLVAMIHGTAAWPASSFVATSVYLLVAGVELAAAHRDPPGPIAS
jgi:hypothetical protein